MKTTTCPQCKRVVKIRPHKFGGEIYARHKMKTSQQLWSDLWRNQDADKQALREETFKPPNPLAFRLDEIDCPMSGQPLEE